MSRRVCVPVERRPWNYFDRQREVYSSTYTSTTTTTTTSDDNWAKLFDDELSKVKSNLFTLKSLDDFDDHSLKRILGDDDDFGLSSKSSAKSLLKSNRGFDSDIDARFGKANREFDRDIASTLSSVGIRDGFGLGDDFGTGSGSKSSRSVESSSSHTSESYSSTTSGGNKSEFSSKSESSSSTSGGGKLQAGLTSDRGLSKKSDLDLMLKVDHPIVETADGNKRLALRFDVSEFRPEEIVVRVNGSTLTVVAEMKRETATSKVYKKFSRQYTLPDAIEPEKLTSILSSDGVLDIEGPAPAGVGDVPKVRMVPLSLL